LIFDQDLDALISGQDLARELGNADELNE